MRAGADQSAEKPQPLRRIFNLCPALQAYMNRFANCEATSPSKIAITNSSHFVVVWP